MCYKDFREVDETHSAPLSSCYAPGHLSRAWVFRAGESRQKMFPTVLKAKNKHDIYIYIYIYDYMCIYIYICVCVIWLSCFSVLQACAHIQLPPPGHCVNDLRVSSVLCHIVQICMLICVYRFINPFIQFIQLILYLCISTYLCV